jgi:hypothetical protein
MMGGFAAHHKRLLTEFKPGSPKADYRDRRLCASPEIQTDDLDGNKRIIGGPMWITNASRASNLRVDAEFCQILSSVSMSPRGIVELIKVPIN